MTGPGVDGPPLTFVLNGTAFTFRIAPNATLAQLVARASFGAPGPDAPLVVEVHLEVTGLAARFGEARSPRSLPRSPDRPRRRALDAGAEAAC